MNRGPVGSRRSAVGGSDEVPESSYLFAKMSGEQIREAARNGRAVLVPVAAIENHADYLPVDVDNLITERICQEAARRQSRSLLCAPAIHYGYNEHNMDFPGTIDVHPTHFIDYCIDVGNSLARNGFEVVLFVNGHGSNGILLEIAARQVNLKSDIKCASVSYWALITDEIAQVRESVSPGGMGHACELETSLYLYLDEKHVQREKYKTNIIGHVTKHIWHEIAAGGPVRFVTRWSRLSPNTMTSGDPTLASVEKGRIFFEAAVGGVTEVAQELIDLQLGPPVDHQHKPPRAP